jgi:hypothetical protein
LVPEGEDPESYRVQHIDFDWGYSLMKLLDNIYQGYNKDGISKDAVKKITGLDMTKTVAWSSKFGIKKEDALSWSEMGNLIQDNDEMIKELQDLMVISRKHIPWQELIKPRKTAVKKLRRTMAKMNYWAEEHATLKQEKAPKEEIAYAKKRADRYSDIANRRYENIPELPYYDPPPKKVARKPSVKAT